MLLITLYFSALAAVATALPTLFERATNATNTTNPFVFTNSFGLNFTQMNASLPNVTIFATGMHPCVASRTRPYC